MKVAGTFGAGLARTGLVCGAVTGSLMVIGLQRSKTRQGDDDSREFAYSRAQEFMEQFVGRNRSLLCRDLLGVDVSTPEGMAKVRTENLFAKICPKYVKDAAEILEGLL